MPSAPQLSQDEFIVLIARHERRIRGFVATLVRQREDIDEIVQQTCLTAWKKRQEFVRANETLDRDFARWVCTIARFEALGYVRKKRGSSLLFDSELVSKLADMQLTHDHYDDRREALQCCIEKLPVNQKELVRRYYRARESAAAIAREESISRQAVFKRLRIIRTALVDCVTRSLEAGEAV